MWSAWQCWAQLCLTTPTCHPQTMDKGRLQKLTHPLGVGQANGGYPGPLWSPRQSGGDKMDTVFLHGLVLQRDEMKEADMDSARFMPEGKD